MTPKRLDLKDFVSASFGFREDMKFETSDYWLVIGKGRYSGMAKKDPIYKQCDNVIRAALTINSIFCLFFLNVKYM